MAAQNAPSEKRTTRRKCESAHIQVSLGCARFFFALSILRSQILFCNRKSKQRLDRHETIVAERCETFRNYSIAELNAKLLMLEQLRSKGYLAPEVYQAQANEIGAELAKLKDVRQEKFNSKAASMLEEVKKLKMLIFELEEPLEAFDEKLFLEIVKSIQINKEDEMSVEFLGGLRFKERI